MPAIIGFRCSECGALATKSMKWIRKVENNQTTETLLCGCGNREWKFVELKPEEIRDETLVVTKGV